MSTTDGSALATSVSVVICAYTEKRWEDLRSAVNSALGQTHPPTEVLLVIDHNPELLERAHHEFTSVPDDYIRVLPNQHRQGLSGARNTGVAAATGDILAFLDDDATAQPDWLESLLTHYADPDVMGVGGLAEPLWPDGHSRPYTLPAATGGLGELDWVVGCSYAGLPVAAAPLRNLMGCNMSIRAVAFGQVGGFSEDLGRVGRTPLGGEETELCIRVRRRVPGGQFIYEPAARVRHRVSDDRLTWRYLLRRGYAEGLSKAAISRIAGPDDALSTERGYVAKVLPRAVIRQLGQVGPSGFAGAVAVVAVLAATTIGYLRGLVSSVRPLRAAPAVAPTPERTHIPA
ncbi:glycosyltransferase [Flexivirga sp. ID2601S]|uniref:Glycosyltransferase n=1 Tax=Flexivirga aerilata TaxID=1656889 RepID=A0A849ACE0_9MICO|nr:glycosyltransferase [Flexivirga aerilata]NNG38554.1 glycosyltransferase [Flexivirga aerilata]